VTPTESVTPTETVTPTITPTATPSETLTPTPTLAPTTNETIHSLIEELKGLIKALKDALHLN
jgi:hypothetical protein